MHESGENYLETILMIKEKKGVVRSIDVARALNFSKPSVSRAMGLLRDQGFISMEQGGDIQLTEEGLAKAKSIYARHLLLTAFLQLMVLWLSKLHSPTQRLPTAALPWCSHQCHYALREHIIYRFSPFLLPPSFIIASLNLQSICSLVHSAFSVI